MMKTKVAGWLLLGLLCGNLLTSGAADKSLDLLHQINFEVTGYPEAKQLPAKFSKAQEVVDILDKNKPLALHMEVLRRGYQDLPLSEQQILLGCLLKRYQADSNNPVLFFDHGYAQLVYKDNKTGLFFLRKANDRLKDQFSSLAYAMAQADVDLSHEKASPQEMTYRKLDVTYKLGDAVNRDAQQHQPGFWPTFVKVVQKLSAIDAYKDYTNTDFSLQYVPFGTTPFAAKPKEGKIVTAESTALPPAEKAGSQPVCDLKLSATSLNWQKLYKSKFLPLGEGKLPSTVHAFSTDQSNQYQIVVLNPRQQVIANFLAPAATSMIEDLEGDGTFELVVRQYRQTPLDPVKVYRYTPCALELDKKVASFFL